MLVVVNWIIHPQLLFLREMRGAFHLEWLSSLDVAMLEKGGNSVKGAFDSRQTSCVQAVKHSHYCPYLAPIGKTKLFQVPCHDWGIPHSFTALSLTRILARGWIVWRGSCCNQRISWIFHCLLYQWPLLSSCRARRKKVFLVLLFTIVIFWKILIDWQ